MGDEEVGQPAEGTNFRLGRKMKETHIIPAQESRI